MRRRRVTAIVVTAAFVLGATVLLRADRSRQVEQLALTASADAVAAVAEQDPMIEHLARVHDAVGQCLAAISASTARTLAVVASARQRARVAVARQAALRRVARERQARQARQRESGGLLVGDSVSLGAASCLEPRGYELDSEVGRQFTTGLARLRAHAADGLPATVVVHLGTNGPFSADGFEEVMALAGGQRRVVWVTIALPELSRYAFADEQNELIRSLAARYRNARLADWATAADRHPEWTSDGIHLTGPGCEGFTDVVDAAVRAP